MHSDGGVSTSSSTGGWDSRFSLRAGNGVGVCGNRFSGSGSRASGVGTGDSRCMHQREKSFQHAAAPAARVAALVAAATAAAASFLTVLYLQPVVLRNIFRAGEKDSLLPPFSQASSSPSSHFAFPSSSSSSSPLSPLLNLRFLPSSPLSSATHASLNDVPPLRIFVYELGGNYTDDILAMEMVWYNEQYQGEEWLARLIMAPENGVRTLDPDQANLFYIPFFSARHIMGRGVGHVNDTRAKWLWERALGEQAQMWKDVLHRVRNNFPFFNRSNGRDHFSTIGGDRGRCDVLQYLSPSVYREMFFVVNNGEFYPEFGGPKTNRTLKCVVRGRDVVIPPPIDSVSLVRPNDTARGIFLGFRFIRDKGTFYCVHFGYQARYELYERFQNASVPDWSFGRGQDWTNLLFSACPPGIAQWTSRVYKSLLSGAIPLTFYRFNMMPFEDELDYAAFTVNVDPSHIFELQELMAVLRKENKTIHRLQDGLVLAQEQLHWTGNPEEGAEQLVLRTLRRRAAEAIPFTTVSW